MVTLSRVPRSKAVTVSEVNLLPGEGALLSPQWLPWADRLAPGDLSAGRRAAQAGRRPVPGAGLRGDRATRTSTQLALWELGLGRPRVLSLLGREDAAQRWYEGSHGPRDPHAEQAPAKCTTCGYFVPMAGALRQVFGVCANEWSPSDGSVVSLDHGCGAHSEVDVEHAQPRWSTRRCWTSSATRPSRSTARPEAPDVEPEPPETEPAPTEPTRRRRQRVTDPFGTAGIRQRVLAAWAAAPVRLREDANTEEDLALGGYRDRLVVELAQNAADAAARAGVPGRLSLTLRERPGRAAGAGRGQHR